MFENRFYKVANEGFSISISTFFNPITKESFSKKVWDCDDDRLLDDYELQELRFMPLDEGARHLWLNHNGVVCIGDTIEVYKGRKVPIGTIGKVVKEYIYRDRYGRGQAHYFILEDGCFVPSNNCRLANV